MDFFVATKPLRDRVWVSYLAAVIGPMMALGVRFAIGDILIGFPFLTFFPAILAATALGDWRCGALAALLSGVLAAYYLMEPTYSFALEGPSAWIALSLFAIASATIIALMHVINHAMVRLSIAGDELRGANAALEQRVAERTRELAEANAALRAEIETREAAEAQIRQTQKMEALGQLTGGIAHDFNNMLAIVIGSLDLASRRLPATEANVLKFIDNAMEGANRAAALTRRLLAFSRQQPLAPTLIDLNASVQGMAELLRRTIGETIRLECVLGGGLWRTRVDPAQLESALINLAVNARDATNDGGKLTIETLNGYLDESYAAAHAEVAAGQYVVVAVSDTGTGMAPEVAARAFDPFFTTKGTGRGSGLGLSQVYGFVKQSGGHVKIYTEPGQGTTVKIYLRRAAGEDLTGEIDGRRVAQAVLPSGGADEIILVVEDEAAVRHATVEALRELGYTVRQAASGDEALAILQEQPSVKLLFTDVVMPGMNGRQLAGAAVQRRPDLKVLYATGYTPNAIVHHGVVDPGVELLMKPFSLDELARKVRSVLDRGGS